MFPLAQHSTAQYSTTQHSTVQHSTVQYNTAQYSTVQHSTVTDQRKPKNVLHLVAPRVPLFLFLLHFAVTCDLSLNRRMVTWNLFVKSQVRKKNMFESQSELNYPLQSYALQFQENYFKLHCNNL